MQGCHLVIGAPVFGEWRVIVVSASYPEAQAGRIKAMTRIGVWQLGHLNTGLGLEV